jgi:hypothetical protein
MRDKTVIIEPNGRRTWRSGRCEYWGSIMKCNEVTLEPYRSKILPTTGENP